MWKSLWHMRRSSLCRCRWTQLFLGKRLWIKIILPGSLLVKHCSLEKHPSSEKQPSKLPWKGWEEHSFLFPSFFSFHFLSYPKSSELPSLLDTSFLKPQPSFIFPSPHGNRLLLVPEKSAFCSTMSNTFYKWSVTQESANVFCKGLYNHNVVLLDMQSMVRVQSDMAHIRLVNICGCGIRLGLQFEVYWPFL